MRFDKLPTKSLNDEDLYFPPPWNINEFPEKTKGWIEFQKAMKDDHKYYLNKYNSFDEHELKMIHLAIECAQLIIKEISDKEFQIIIKEMIKQTE